MDSKTTAPPTPDPSAVIFQNATIDKAKRSEFSNSKFVVNNNFNFTKEGENMMLESSDVIDFFRNVVQPFLAEVRKNDQSQSTVGDTTGTDGGDTVSQAVTADHTMESDPANVMNLVPPEPSSLPVASVVDQYTRSMLKCLIGYPLYEPQPFSELSTEYMRHGIKVGDVGFVREDGVFDFLFNVCPPKNKLVNPPNLSDGFCLEIADWHSATRPARALPRKTCLFQDPIARTKSGEYICEGSEGAILELPEGAIQEEATDILPFKKLAARHGIQWYEYTMTRSRKISNGSLYLITSLAKCAQWGIAVFDRKCAPGQGLKFDKKRSLPFGKSPSKYYWKGSHAFHTRVSDPDQGDTLNQCIFLRGYKIMICQDIFDNLGGGQLCRSNLAMPSSSSQAGSISLTQQPAMLIGGGGGGSDPMSERLTGEGLLSWTTMSNMTNSDEVVLHANPNSSLVHPSDLINAALLNQSPNAKVALTHDGVWCDLLRDNFPKLNYATLINIARSYTNVVDEYECAILEKIPDSSGILNENNRTLEGAEIPALQEPLGVPNDSHTSLPAIISVTLPRELVEHILLLLGTQSILTCRLVNREFNQIIQSSTVLQYFLACEAAGVIDNPQSPLSYAERLEALKKREDAWKKLKPAFEMIINVKHQTSSQLCRSTEGVYFLDDNNRKYLNYCHLTSFHQENLRWIRIPVHGPAPDWSGILVNFVAAIYEHDLIVNIISSDIENQTDMQQHSLDLVLLKFSTGEYHPLARHPRIHVQRSPEVDPWVSSKISGDNLALVVHSDDGRFSDKLFIFDWKTGRKLLQHEAIENAYSGLVFVSPELLLVPNRILSHFEVWHISPQQLDPKPPVQILSLQIPAVSPEYSIFEFDCYGEPNPFLHAMPYLPPRPFFSSPENSIITVKLRMVSNSRRPASYNLVMHRRALLDTIQKWTSSSFLEPQEYLPTWLTNEVTVHQIADPEDGSLQLDVQSTLVSTVPHPRSAPRTRRYFPTFSTSRISRIFRTSHISGNSGSSHISLGLSTNPSTSQSTFPQIPWAKWGPPISRWFQISENQGRWLRSNGQRCAFSDRNPLNRRKLMISVADFNPHNFRRAMPQLRSGEDEDNGSNGNRKGKEEEEFEILDHTGVFSEEVHMGLKCVVYRTPDEYDFDLVMVDEQRLLGVKLNPNGWIESVKVLYIG